MPKLGPAAQQPDSASTAPAVTFSRTISEQKGLPPKGSRRNSKWYYSTHPERWGWDDEAKAFLPRPRMMSLTPGSMGAGNSKTPGEISDEDKVIAAWDALGWTAVKPWDPRLGPWQDYVVGFPLARGGYQWLPKWVTPRILGKRVAFVVDDNRRLEFLRYLSEANIIPPMDDVIKNEIITIQRRRMTKIEQDFMATPNALIASRMEMNRIKLSRMLGVDEAQAVAEAREAEAVLKKRAHDLKTAQGFESKWADQS